MKYEFFTLLQEGEYFNNAYKFEWILKVDISTLQEGKYFNKHLQFEWVSQ